MVGSLSHRNIRKMSVYLNTSLHHPNVEHCMLRDARQILSGYDKTLKGI